MWPGSGSEAWMGTASPMGEVGLGGEGKGLGAHVVGGCSGQQRGRGWARVVGVLVV